MDTQKSKLVADFLTERLRGPKNLTRTGEALFLTKLGILLDRLGASFSIRSLSLRPVKASMFAPSEEIEIPSRILVLMVDGGLFYSKGNFIEQEQNARIKDMLPVSRHELTKISGGSSLTHADRVSIIAYVNGLQQEFYGWLTARTTLPNLKNALPL